MRDELVKAHLPLVRAIAKKTIHFSRLPLEDLIQEGTVGLIIAAGKFDPDRGTKFSSYATFWIKQAMFKAISEQSHCVKIPVYVQETLSKFNKLKREQPTATNEQIARQMNLAPNKIEDFLGAYNKPVSLNNDEVNMADLIADDSANFIKVIELENLKNDLTCVIETLKEREQEVIKMRFGLDDTETYTLEQIGSRYGVTKECIRQTEMRALNKMRASLIEYS